MKEKTTTFTCLWRALWPETITPFIDYTIYQNKAQTNQDSDIK